MKAKIITVIFQILSDPTTIFADKECKLKSLSYLGLDVRDFAPGKFKLTEWDLNHINTCKFMQLLLKFKNSQINLKKILLSYQQYVTLNRN